MADIHATPLAAPASVRDYRPSQIARRPALVAAELANLSVLGFDVVDESQAETIEWMVDRVRRGETTRIAFLNAHCLNQARRDWRYAAALRTANVLLPDGAGVELAAKFRGQRLTANLNGTDLFEPLCRKLAEAGRSIYLLGGRPGVASRAAEQIVAEVPGLVVAGTRDGYFEPQDEAEVIADINRSGAAAVFVAFGVPAQDVWLARVAPQLNAPLTLGIGGLLDFVSGMTPRAPVWMRRGRLEWLYRLRQEPRRMWRRYVLGNIEFLARAAAHAFRSGRQARKEKSSRSLKRLLDFAGAAAGLALLAPLMALTAAAIRLESRGPALFRQTRVGEDGRLFTCLKFRSMHVDAEARLASLKADNDRDDGVTFKVKNDPRITDVGRVIRKFSIDELPQLWNVLAGDMSLVGPRPGLPQEVEKYSARDRRRLAGKPGLTGPWQVGGRADISFQDMVLMDVDYLKTRTIWIDLRLILATPWAVIRAKGAY